MATILNNQKSTGSSPYAYYTITAEYSNRTTYGITISGTITSHLASSSSSLGTGPTMGLNAFLTLNGVEQSAVSLKSTSSSWSGTGNHNANYSFTISNLQPTQTSVPISVRVSRTGSAAGNYSKGAALKSTTCSSLDIPQGVGQSVFNSITNTTYNGTFSMSITSYSGYDVLEIKNGNTTIQTYYGVSNGVAYSFDSTAQNTILGLIGSSNSYVDLTARLTTYTASGGASLGYTDKTIRVSLPDYTPTISLYSYSDSVSTYNTYKNTTTDIIKSLSKPTIVVSLSNNYDNTYTSAVCNSTQGVIDNTNRRITFTAVNQADNYTIGITDSRNKYASVVVLGNSYTASIKTIQWYKGSLPTDVERPSPTGNTAVVSVKPTYYDGTNLKSSALQNIAFTFTYTESGSSAVSVSSSSFSQSGGTYTYTIQNLDPTKVVSWSISGTDRIGVAMNGDSDTLKIGMPVWNAYKTNAGAQTFKVNGDLSVSGAIDGSIDSTNVWNTFKTLSGNARLNLQQILTPKANDGVAKYNRLGGIDFNDLVEYGSGLYSIVGTAHSPGANDQWYQVIQIVMPDANYVQQYASYMFGGKTIWIRTGANGSYGDWIVITNDYRMDELPIGTWTSGQIVYRRAFDGNLNANGRLPARISVGGTIVNIWGIVRSVYNNRWVIGSHYPFDNGYDSCFVLGGTEFDIETGGYFANCYWYAIVEYIKE